MRWSWWLLTAAVVACGGRVVDDGSREDGSRSGGSSSGASSNLGGGVDLPPCKPGFEARAEPDRDCNWVDLDGLCYAEKLDACACACADTGGDVCSSPFAGEPDSKIPVDCF